MLYMLQGNAIATGGAAFLAARFVLLNFPFAKLQSLARWLVVQSSCSWSRPAPTLREAAVAHRRQWMACRPTPPCCHATAVGRASHGHPAALGPRSHWVLARIFLRLRASILNWTVLCGTFSFTRLALLGLSRRWWPRELFPLPPRIGDPPRSGNTYNGRHEGKSSPIGRTAVC